MSASFWDCRVSFNKVVGLSLECIVILAKTRYVRATSCLPKGLRRRCFLQNESNNIPGCLVSHFERVKISLVSVKVIEFLRESYVKHETVQESKLCICEQTINRNMLRMMIAADEGRIYDLFRLLIFNAILSRLHLRFMVNKIRFTDELLWTRQRIEFMALLTTK